MPQVHAQRSKTIHKCPRSLLLAIACITTSSQSSDPPQLISSIGIPCQWVLGETMTTRAFPGGRTIAPPGERGGGAPYGRGPG
jgi:hypothetical protein